MSTTTETSPSGAEAPDQTETGPGRLSILTSKRYRLWIAVAVGLVALSTIRTLSGAGDLTSGGTIAAA